MSNRWKYAAAGACVVGLGMIGCQPDPTPFNPRAAQDSERSLAKQMQDVSLPPITNTLQSPYQAPVRNPDGTVRQQVPATRPVTGPIPRPEDIRRMTLQQVIQTAVLNNPDIRAAGYDPAIEQTRITEAEARFDPRFFVNLQHAQRDDAAAGIQNARGRYFFYNDTWQTQYQTGFRQNLESGGQIELREQLTYSYNDPQTTVLNPYYESQLVAEITQPVLKDFGGQVNRARIDVQRLTTRVSVLDYRKTLEEQLFNLEQAYWQQVQAVRDVESLERLLQRSENTADILVKRFGQDVSRIQTSDAVARIEERRTQLIRARSRVRELSLTIKRLMNDPSLPVSGPQTIIPATAPVEEPIHLDLAEQVDAAYENRYDLAQQLLRIESAGIVVRVAKNNLLPQLNLVGGAGFQGLKGGAGPAFEDAHDFDGFNFKIGFQFEVPIGNREANAIYKRSSMQRQQAIEQYDVLVKDAAREVSQALNTQQSAYEVLHAARQATLAAHERLAALQDREDRGEPLTADFVNRKLDAQQQLAADEQTEDEAASLYQIAIAALERAKGTLLRYNNVQMQEEALPFAFRPIPREPLIPRSRNMASDRP